MRNCHFTVLKVTAAQNLREKRKARLDLDGTLDGLPLLLSACLGLDTHDTTSPVSAALLVLAGEALVDGADQLAQLRLVLALDLSES